MDAAPIALSCRGLKKRFGDVVAVDGVDLEVRRGECFGLLGPNGAGKTTTVEMLEGLTTPNSGEVQLFGIRWGVDDHALRGRLGVALQQTDLGDKLRVYEVVRLFRSFHARGRAIDEVLALVDLGTKRNAMVSTLSGGQKQRLALAVALVGDPELMFLDEPTTGLDPQARLHLWDVIDEFRGRQGTVLLTTHYMEEAARLCDRVAIMDLGKIIAQGTPKELVAALGKKEIVQVREPTLDDVFISLTGKALRDG